MYWQASVTSVFLKGRRCRTRLLFAKIFMAIGFQGFPLKPSMKLYLLKFLFRSNWVEAPSGGADTWHLKKSFETRGFNNRQGSALINTYWYSESGLFTCGWKLSKNSRNAGTIKISSWGSLLRQDARISILS